MKKQRAKITEKDVEFILNSELKATTIAELLRCSVGTVNYYKYRGSIWARRKPARI